MSLNSYLADYSIREIHHFAVKTSPAETYRTMCDFDFAKIPWIRALFRLRTFLDRKGDSFFHLTLRDAYANGGFTLLEEVPDKELTVGAIGKFWRPIIAFQEVEPEEFCAFNQSGFGKVAWSLQCEPIPGGGTFGSFEVRVGSTDRVSNAKMRMYYLLIGPFSRAIRRSVFKHVRQQLGDLFSDQRKGFVAPAQRMDHIVKTSAFEPRERNV